MIIELWTWKSAGKHKNNFTYWKQIRSDFIPEAGRTFIYKTKTGKTTEFKISHIEYEAKYGSLRVQLCITKEKD